MDELCKTHLKENWSSETGEPWTQAWREELGPEEQAYVSGLDRDYGRGILALCSAILVREKVRARYRPEEVLELETVWDHCRLRLRDGRTLLARLGRDGALRLEEPDPSGTKKQPSGANHWTARHRCVTESILSIPEPSRLVKPDSASGPPRREASKYGEQCAKFT